MNRLLTTSLVLATLLLGSCAVFDQELEDAAWSRIGKGTHTVGGSTGWAFYEANITLTDTTGAPMLGTGTSNTDLEPVTGGALKYNYFLTDNIALGAIFEFRSFDPDPTAPLESTIDADEYTSLHYLLSSRYWSNPFGESQRWKWFTGLDLNYTPEVDIDATVIYAPGFNERVALSGDSFWTLSPVLGMSYLVRDNLSMEFGGFYEFPLDSSEDTLVLNIPNGLGGTAANIVDAEVEPEGLIFFFGLTYYF